MDAKRDALLQGQYKVRSRKKGQKVKHSYFSNSEFEQFFPHKVLHQNVMLNAKLNRSFFYGAILVLFRFRPHVVLMC